MPPFYNIFNKIFSSDRKEKFTELIFRFRQMFGEFRGNFSEIGHFFLIEFSAFDAKIVLKDCVRRWRKDCPKNYVLI